MKIHIDHIDPSWEEGRDYQLVCGLDTPLNYEERDALLNKSKNNRFLPWRWCRDEIGEVPVNPGDLCLFLDPDTNEWVLEEFMGKWWYEKTIQSLWHHHHTRTHSEETKRKLSEVGKGRKMSESWKHKLSERVKEGWKNGIYDNFTEAAARVHRGVPLTEEHKRKLSEAGMGREWSDESRKKVSDAATERWAKISPARRREHALKSAATRKANQEKRKLSLMAKNDPLMPDFED